MIVTACLAWYMEPPEFLARCVRSLAPFCDRLLALDGRWDLFPGDSDTSTVDELIAIDTAARETGLEVALVDGGAPFASQVAKRDRLMELAGDGSDWLLVIDGDEHLAELDELTAAAARAELEQTDLEVASVLLQPMNAGWPYREMPANEVTVRRIYRAGVRCPGPAHNVYELDGRYLEGDTVHVTREPALDLSAVVRLRHDNQNRGRARDAAAKTYRRARGRARAEAWT